jgi:hypothetical protein
MTVAILGASPKPERYAYKAFRMLQDYHHKVVPVHPALKELEGIPVSPSLDDITEEIHTLTVYVGPRFIGEEIDRIVRLKPGRVILNPGTESPELMAALDQAGIPYLKACTLVMLRTGQFEPGAA